MAERGVLAFCLQAPGETAAAVACAAVASGLAYALAAILTATSPPSPRTSALSHPRRPTRKGGPPASGWRLVTTRARDWMQEHYARAARQRTKRSAAASPNTEKAKWPLDAFLCAHVAACPCDICMHAYKMLSCSYNYICVLIRI